MVAVKATSAIAPETVRPCDRYLQFLLRLQFRPMRMEAPTSATRRRAAATRRVTLGLGPGKTQPQVSNRLRTAPRNAHIAGRISGQRPLSHLMTGISVSLRRPLDSARRGERCPLGASAPIDSANSFA